MIYSLSKSTTIFHNERSIPCRNLSKKIQEMARNLLLKLCAKLIVFIKNIISSPDFIDRNRLSNTAFTRQRKLPFHFLRFVCLYHFFFPGYICNNEIPDVPPSCACQILAFSCNLQCNLSLQIINKDQIICKF